MEDGSGTVVTEEGDTTMLAGDSKKLPAEIRSKPGSKVGESGSTL
jgi:hypothetical protein